MWSSRYSPGGAALEEAGAAGEEPPVVDGEVHLELDDRARACRTLRDLEVAGWCRRSASIASATLRAASRTAARGVVVRPRLERRRRRPRPRRRRRRASLDGDLVEHARRSPGSTHLVGLRRTAAATPGAADEVLVGHASLLDSVCRDRARATMLRTMLRRPRRSHARESVAKHGVHERLPCAGLARPACERASSGTAAVRGAAAWEADTTAIGRRSSASTTSQALRRSSSRSTTPTSGSRRGEFFSMLGPSGCGKTTTLRMIAGFEQPSEGEIRLEGKDVSRVPPYKRNVNTVFQQYALFPHMTVCGQRRVRAARPRRSPKRRDRASASARCSRSCASPTSPTASRASSPAASSSGSRSPARS